MELDGTWLFLSLIPGGIGFVLFVYGKKQSRWPHLVTGLILMIYPYFTTSAAAMIGVCALICGALWYAVRAGW